jgi:hypothetical protein
VRQGHRARGQAKRDSLYIQLWHSSHPPVRTDSALRRSAAQKIASPLTHVQTQTGANSRYDAQQCAACVSSVGRACSEVGSAEGKLCGPHSRSAQHSMEKIKAFCCDQESNPGPSSSSSRHCTDCASCK